MEMLRQSDRDFHRCSIRFGWMDLTRVTGTERVANLLVFAIILHMKQGEEMMSPFLERRPGLSMKKMRETLKLLMLYEQWYMSDHVPRLDVITTQTDVDVS